MNANKWNESELEYLRDKWGSVSILTIAKKLNRSKNAIIIKAQRLQLGAFLDSGDYVTLNQLVRAVTGSNNAYSYKKTSWIKERGLPVHMRKVVDNSFKIVYLKEFWKWAEQNKSFLDFTKMEQNILGIEPEWVKEQRYNDFIKNHKCISTPWTKLEDERLVMLLKQYKYSYAELSKLLCRTCGAIQKHCCDLGIKERPVRAGNHTKWTLAQLELLTAGIKQGRHYEDIAEMVGKSSKALRGKVYALYQTEKLDRVRSILEG